MKYERLEHPKSVFSYGAYAKRAAGKEFLFVLTPLAVGLYCTYIRYRIGSRFAFNFDGKLRENTKMTCLLMRKCSRER